VVACVWNRGGSEVKCAPSLSRVPDLSASKNAGYSNDPRPKRDARCGKAQHVRLEAE